MIMKFAKILFEINNRLYNYTSHLVILSTIVLIFIFPSSHFLLESLRSWIEIGFIVYLALVGIRLLRDGGLSKKDQQDFFTKKGFLGYLVGLNIALVLGPLSILLILLLLYVAKQEQK